MRITLGSRYPKAAVARAPERRPVPGQPGPYRRRGGRGPLLGALLVGLLPAVAWAAGDDARLAAAVDSAFQPLLRAYDVPGLAVAVTAAGRSHVFSYGVASRSPRQPVTPDTLFEIGSISKVFTATLVAHAQALGTVSLDDHPGTYMPQLRGRPIDAATLLHLGTYTAGGLPLQFPGTVSDQAGMLSYLRQWQPSAAPGTQRRYSNPSIGLLGHVTALAMKADFADLVETRLLPELGLRHTHIRVPAAQMHRYAWGHDKDGKPIRVSLGVLGAPAYGVKSTAADMIRFVQANLRPDGLQSPSMRHAVARTQRGQYRVGAMVQGLGWEQYPYPVTRERLLAGNSNEMVLQAQAATPLDDMRSPAGPVLFNKTGSTNGFGAYAAFVPAKGIGIVMLANRNFPVPARITAALAVLDHLASMGP